MPNIFEGTCLFSQSNQARSAYRGKSLDTLCGIDRIPLRFGISAAHPKHIQPVQKAEHIPLIAEREKAAAAIEKEREKVADTLKAPDQPKPMREQSEREPH